jgi:hypothetical protein
MGADKGKMKLAAPANADSITLEDLEICTNADNPPTETEIRIAAEAFVERMNRPETIRICGRDFPVIGYTIEDRIPIVDIPFLSEEKQKRIAESPENLRKLRKNGWERDAESGQWMQKKTGEG